MTDPSLQTGINRLAVTFANTLTSLKLTILDSLSWHSIEMIGKFCTELRLFHLELWDRIFTDNVQEINKPNNRKRSLKIFRLGHYTISMRAYWWYPYPYTRFFCAYISIPSSHDRFLYYKWSWLDIVTKSYLGVVY